MMSAERGVKPWITKVGKLEDENISLKEDIADLQEANRHLKTTVANLYHQIEILTAP